MTRTYRAEVFDVTTVVSFEAGAYNQAAERLTELLAGHDDQRIVQLTSLGQHSQGIDTIQVTFVALIETTS
jgi:hypothetical protein